MSMIILQKTVNMKFRTFMAFMAFITLFAGCDDESKEQDLPGDLSTLISVNFGLYLVDGASGYLVVTDTLNAVLGKVPITNFATLDLHPEKNFAGETVNAYFVLQTPDFFHTSSFLHIKRGSTYDFSGVPVFGMQNPVRLRPTNVPEFDYLTMGTNAITRTYTNSNLSDTSNWGTHLNYIEGGSIYAQVVSDDEGKYGFFPITGDQSSYEFSLGDLNQVSLRTEISVPDHIHGYYFIIGNKAEEGDAQSNYWLFERNFNGNSFPIFYPDITFDKYISSLTLTLNERNETIGYNRSGELVTEYAPITFNASVTGRLPNNFQYSPSGDFDFYNAEFVHENGVEFVHVYAPRKVRKFVIPDFSSLLSVPARDFNKFKLQFLGLSDVLDHTEDSPYFKIYSSYPPNIPNLNRRSYPF